MDHELSAGEIDILVDGLTDDVSLTWGLIHLGVMRNPEMRHGWLPSPEDLDVAFTSFRRLVEGGYAEIGDIRYVDGGPPGRVAPVEHVPEDIDDVSDRVDRAVAAAEVPTDWAFQCWLVNTPKGDETARKALPADQ